MKFRNWSWACTLAFAASCAHAGNYQLEGKRNDGQIVSFSSEPPPYVAVKTKGINSAPEDILIFENEQCELVFPTTPVPHDGLTDAQLEAHHAAIRKRSYFTCPASGKSPLAGTTYKFLKHVGDGCVKEEDHDIYVCNRGCTKRTPTHLTHEAYCGP